jgi:hypothetical protein
MLEKPADWSEEKWQDHLIHVRNWTGFDGLSAEEVSEILLGAEELGS